MINKNINKCKPDSRVGGGLAGNVDEIDVEKQQRRHTLRRLMIYLLISFGIPYVIIFIYIANVGWTIENDWYGVVPAVAMLCPAVAHVLTRLITHEGFTDSYFAMKIKGNVRYFVIGLCFPVIVGILLFLGAVLFLTPQGTLEASLQKIDYGVFLSTTIYVVSVSIASVLLGFGEEFGWRGYMMPKLEQLMPGPAAVIVGGTIWGLWHAPLIACGHNFGTGYAGYPWVGIGLMCISCIAIGFYLTALTKATHSVLPASLAHIAINNVCGAVSGTLLGYVEISDERLIEINSTLDYPLIMMIVISVLSVLTGVAVTLLRSRNKE